MKILFDSYNEIKQNTSGGMQIKIDYMKKHIPEEIKMFDKWNDKIEDYDILHILMLSYQEYDLVRLAKSKGLPVVVTAVVPSSSKLQMNIKYIYSRISPIMTLFGMCKGILEQADLIIAETIYEKEFISINYRIPSEKIVVIPNGISVDTNIEQEPGTLFREKTGIKGDFVLQVGRFEENKNQLSVIRALKGTGTKLVFIGGANRGDDEYYSQCVNEADENTLFLGWIRHDDPMLVSAYNACKSFVLPSHHEIFGNALFEAAACGANIVATQVLPLENWGIDCMCERINPNDTQDIKDKILKSMSREKNEDLKLKVIKDFCWESIGYQYVELYRKLLNK